MEEAFRIQSLVESILSKTLETLTHLTGISSNQLLPETKKKVADVDQARCLPAVGQVSKRA